MEDIFIAHISGMDVFDRSLVIADTILRESDYLKLRANRYASFNTAKGIDFEAGKLSLTDMYAIAKEVGEPAMISGKKNI